MSNLREAIEAMTVTVVSPDRRVRALARGNLLPAVSFTSPDAHEHYADKEELSTQVSIVLEKAIAGTATGRRRLRARHTGLRHDDEPHWDASIRRMSSQLRELRSWAESPHRLVRMETVGGVAWRVRMRPGALRRVGAAVIAEINAAVRLTDHAYRRDAHEIRTHYLGPIGAAR